jgi:hypothetical protein
MNFVYLKLAFDSGYSLFFFDASNTSELVSSITSIGFLSLVCLYPGWLAWSAGKYHNELARAENDSDV